MIITYINRQTCLVVLALFLSPLFSSCNLMYSGAMLFMKPGKRKQPSIARTLDYSQVSSWYVHPDKENDAADGDFLGYRDRQDSATAAVFFIHPTSYFSSKSWNKPVTTETKDGFLERMVLPNQLKVFTGSYKVFVAKYHQATLASFVSKSEQGQQALSLATADLENAFESFLYQIGEQPFVLAGHSQGSYHAISLLHRKVIGTDIEKRFIAAIVPGYTFPLTMLSDHKMPICKTDDDTSCIETWNVLKQGAKLPRFIRRGPLPDTARRIKARELMAVTNPINTGKSFTEAKENEGAYLGGFYPDSTSLVPHLTSVAIDSIQGFVRIPKPTDKRFRKFLMGPGWYHQYEYAMFFVAIRERLDYKRKVFQKSNEE